MEKKGHIVRYSPKALDGMTSRPAWAKAYQSRTDKVPRAFIDSRTGGEDEFSSALARLAATDRKDPRDAHAA